MIEYVIATALIYIFMGLVIAFVEIYESYKHPLYILFPSKRVGLTSKDFLKITFCWLLLLILSLTIKKDREFSKIKLF